MEGRTYTPEQLAEYFQVKKETIQKYIRQGRLNAIQIGNRYRVTEEQLQEFINKNSTAKQEED